MAVDLGLLGLERSGQHNKAGSRATATRDTAASHDEQPGYERTEKRERSNMKLANLGSGSLVTDFVLYFHVVHKGQIIKTLRKVWLIISNKKNRGKSSKCKQTCGKSSNSPSKNQ